MGKPREPPSQPVTQIFYITVDPSRILDDPSTPAGKIWTEILDLVQGSKGFQRLYWGRRLEEEDRGEVQLHTVRDSLASHKAFLASPTFQNDMTKLIRRLTFSPAPPPSGVAGASPDLHIARTAELPLTVRHAHLSHLANPHNPLGGASLLGYPIGTAIYTGASDAWYEGAWPLWTHVVRHVDGCMGIAGGRVEEQVAGLEDGYLVYVGWESVKHHDDYHHTKHFEKHSVILRIGHRGYREYGHVVFVGVREGRRDGEGQKAKL